MSTNIETWNQNLLDIGAMYPFPGTEMLWALLGIASWILWHLIQIRMEGKVLEEEDQIFQDKEKLAQARNLSVAATVFEEAKAHASNYQHTK